MGKVELNTPALVGQADWYIAAQLEKFKQGVRGATPEDVTGSQMRAMALTLATDQAVQDVIAYIVSMEQGADTAVTAATQ